MKLIRWLTVMVLGGLVLLGTGRGVIETGHATHSEKVIILVPDPSFLKDSAFHAWCPLFFYEIMEEALSEIEYQLGIELEIIYKEDVIGYLVEAFDRKIIIDVALVYQQFLPQVVQTGYCKSLNDQKTRYDFEKSHIHYMCVGRTIYALESVLPDWWVILPTISKHQKAFDVAIRLAKRVRWISIDFENFLVTGSNKDVGFEDALNSEILIQIELKAFSPLELPPEVWERTPRGVPREFPTKTQTLVKRDLIWIPDKREFEEGYIRLPVYIGLRDVEKQLGQQIALDIRERGLHWYELTIYVWEIDNEETLKPIAGYVSTIGGLLGTAISLIPGGTIAGAILSIGSAAFPAFIDKNDLMGVAEVTFWSTAAKPKEGAGLGVGAQEVKAYAPGNFRRRIHIKDVDLPLVPGKEANKGVDFELDLEISISETF